jgi:hypothetical protein
LTWRRPAAMSQAGRFYFANEIIGFRRPLALSAS